VKNDKSARNLRVCASLCAAGFFTPCIASGDQFEGNNEPVNAADLPLRQAFEIQLDQSDPDWFALETQSDGVLMIRYLTADGRPRPGVTLYQGSVDGLNAVAFSPSDSVLQVARISPGPYHLQFSSIDSAPSAYGFRASFVEVNDASRRSSNGQYFVLGMELDEAQLEVLSGITAFGQGKTVGVSSATTDLTLVLAEVAEQSRGDVFDTVDFLSTMVNQVFDQIRDIPTIAFDRNNIATDVNAVVAGLQRQENTMRSEFAPNVLVAQLISVRDLALKPSDGPIFERSAVAAGIGAAMRSPIATPD